MCPWAAPPRLARSSHTPRLLDPPPSQGGGGFARGGRGSGEGGMRARPRAATLPPCQKQETRKRAPPSPGQTRTPLGRRGGVRRGRTRHNQKTNHGGRLTRAFTPSQKKNSPAWEEEKRGRGGRTPGRAAPARSPHAAHAPLPLALPTTQMTTPQRWGVCAPLASHRARGRPPFLPAAPPSGHTRARAPLVARRPPPPRPPARPTTHATQHAPRKHTRKGTHTRTREREVPSHPPSQARACPKASPTPRPP